MELSGPSECESPSCDGLDLTALLLLSEQWPRRRRRQSSSNYILGHRRVEL